MKKFYVFIFILLSTSLFSQTDDAYRLNHKAEPVYQLIHLNLDPDKENYTGYTSIDIKVREKMNSFRLHGTEFEITEISLKQDKKDLSITYEFQEYGLLRIITDGTLSAGDYNLTIHFKGNYDKRRHGIVKFSKDSLNYLYTFFEPISARRFFPCFDEPNFKFTYQIEITAPKNYLIVSNTPEEKKTIQNKKKTVLFKKTKPTPSYLLAFAVGPYETTPIPGLSIPGRIILPKGYLEKSQHIKNNTAKILKLLEDYFGLPYPYEKLDFLGASGKGGAMENPGLVIYDDRFLIDSDQMDLWKKRSNISTTAHELAHMWFGNLVSLKWWDDNWLKEGFAEWLAREITLQEFPEVEPMEDIARGNNWALSDDIKSTTEPIYRRIQGNDNPDEVFDGLTYSKSPAVLRMVEYWIGRENFRKAMKSYFEKYAWKNTEAADLYKILEDASGKDINQVMHDFVYQPGIPIIEVTLRNNNTIELSQERYKSLENTNTYSTLWHIPVSLRIYDGKNIYGKFIYLDKVKQEFSFSDISEIEWLNLRGNLLGYYLQTLPTDIFEKIISSEKSSIFEKRDVITGLKYNYLAAHTIPSDLLQLAYIMRNNSDIYLLEPTISRIRSIYFDFRNVIPQDSFNLYFNRALIPYLENVGYEYQLDEPEGKSNSRNTLIGLLRENDEIRNKVIEIGKQYLQTDFFVSSRILIYYIFLFYYEGTSEIYDKVIQRMGDTKDPYEQSLICWTLGWFKEDSMVEKNLTLSISGDLRPMDRLGILRSIQNMYQYDQKNNKSILPWVHEHYSTLRELVSQEDLDEYFLSTLISTEEDLSLFNQLFLEDKRSKILNKNITNKIEEIKLRTELQQRYSEDLINYLDEFVRNH